MQPIIEKMKQYKPSTSERVVQIILLVLIVVGVTLLLTQPLWVPKVVAYLTRNDVQEEVVLDEVVPPQLPSSYKDLVHMIDGKIVIMANGYSEVTAAPDSTTKIITRFFDNEAEGDLNNDGTTDTAFLLTQEGGGSGTFFYVVAALKTENGYIGTNAVFLGDRIAPQTTEIQNGKIIVNYAERSPGAPMTEENSVGVSKTFELRDGTLFEILN